MSYIPNPDLTPPSIIAVIEAARRREAEARAKLAAKRGRAAMTLVKPAAPVLPQSIPLEPYEAWGLSAVQGDLYRILAAPGWKHRDTIAEALFGEAASEPSRLSNLMGRLRQKLRPAGIVVGYFNYRGEAPPLQLAEAARASRHDTRAKPEGHSAP